MILVFREIHTGFIITVKVPIYIFLTSPILFPINPAGFRPALWNVANAVITTTDAVNLNVQTNPLCAPPSP